MVVLAILKVDTGPRKKTEFKITNKFRPRKLRNDFRISVLSISPIYPMVAP